jgi:hypothetical protein
MKLEANSVAACRLGSTAAGFFCFVAGIGVMAAADAQTLPDWSGWWGLNGPFQSELRRSPPPMDAAEFAAMQRASQRDVDVDPNRFCGPRQFVGYSGGFTENVEFLFTPGRVTLINEAGLVRRIYTDGRPLPADPEVNNLGTSVGHWEGESLVVETVGISAAARFPSSEDPGGVAIGRNVRITERITRRDENRLEFEVVTIAPDLFTAPDRRTRMYVRVPKLSAREVSFCVDFDRSIDPVSGEQRFDMTPPPDLPPPPP